MSDIAIWIGVACLVFMIDELRHIRKAINRLTDTMEKS